MPTSESLAGVSASNTKIGADQGHVHFRRDSAVVQARQNTRQVLSLVAGNDPQVV